MTFSAPESLSETIANHLAKKIIYGEMQPGDRIQELSVVKELDVSRGSVREALLILERRYLVTIYPRRGAVVSEISPRHVQDIYELLTDLYILLGTKFTDRWKDESDITPFLELSEELKGFVANEDTGRWGEASFLLISLSYPIAGNTFLEEVLENLAPSVHRTHNMALSLHKKELQANMAYFEQLIECVLNRDKEGVVSTLQAYGNHNRDIVLKILEQKENEGNRKKEEVA